MGAGLDCDTEQSRAGRARGGESFPHGMVLEEGKSSCYRKNQTPHQDSSLIFPL